MDASFFSKSLLTIAQYRHQNILLKKERSYYYRYIMKLSYNIKFLDSKDIAKAIEYVEEFKYKQAKRIRDGFFTKPKKALFLACEDTKDVLEGMRRWDGVGAKNGVDFDDNWKVNFRKTLC